MRACREAAAATGQAIAGGRIPVLVGGDCSSTPVPPTEVNPAGDQLARYLNGVASQGTIGS